MSCWVECCLNYYDILVQYKKHFLWHARHFIRILTVDVQVILHYTRTHNYLRKHVINLLLLKMCMFTWLVHIYIIHVHCNSYTTLHILHIYKTNKTIALRLYLLVLCCKIVNKTQYTKSYSSIVKLKSFSFSGISWVLGPSQKQTLLP